MHDKIPVLIIDPFVLFREGIKRILHEADFHPVWCENLPPTELMAVISDQPSPLLIVGGKLSEALVHITDMKRHYPTIRVVLLLDTVSSHDLREAIRCGADALLLKNTSCEALVSSLRLVLNGVSLFPADLLGSLVDLPERSTGKTKITSLGLAPVLTLAETGNESLRETFGLSSREINVLRYLLDGLPNKEIARILKITEATVKVHVKAILRKSKVRNRTQIAMWASRLGFNPDYMGENAQAA